ncbi:KR domain-containing protein [Metarhizium brunneum]
MFSGCPNGSLDHSTPGDEYLVAVCGIGVRLPGRIRNTRDFWDLLINGKDAIGPVPAARYNVDSFDDSLGGKEIVKSKCGYFLDEDFTRLDTSLTSMTRQEVERCDPQQRQLLEVTKEALDDAGEINYRGQPIGCFVGAYTDDWLHMAAKETQHKGGYILTGSQDYMLSNRLSYEHDLKGPSMTIKTACSAALVALHEACRSIRNGDAISAVVATSSVILTTVVTTAFGLDGILSPDASCKTFDARADGFGRAEAVSAIYIKPVSTALRDGNPIRAVIRGTGTNSDGKSHGLTNPTAESQAALIRKVYKDVGLDPCQTAYIECHGTGTAVGDVVETTAVGSIFGDRGVYIGSVKPNVGHSEGASGLNSLIKAILALEHRIIPPNIKFVQPNPKTLAPQTRLDLADVDNCRPVPFTARGLQVPIRPTAFPSDRAERISINSFGLGGTNAHVIVESYRGYASQRERPQSCPGLFLFSAHTELSLKGQLARYKQFLQQSDPLNHRNVGYTLATRREKLPYRGYTVLDDGRFTDAPSIVKSPISPPNLYLIFSGQGAQWAGMGKALMDSDALFKADIETMEKTLQALSPAPDWSLQNEFLKPPQHTRLGAAEISQPVCTALQVALFNKFARAGIEPTAAVGHSSGEIAAAYASGAISMQAAIVIAYCRGHVMRLGKAKGAMAAVGLGPRELSRFIVNGVQIACENSPMSTTLSGDRPKILDTVSLIRSELPEVPVKLLNVDIAYHSHQMKSLAEEYEELLSRGLITLGEWHYTATSLFISSVTGHAVSPYHAFNPKYWVQNLISTVRFSAAVSKLMELKGDGTMLEVGPHSTLAGPVRQICAGAGRHCSYASAVMRGESSAASILSAFGRLFQEGVPFDLAALYPTSAKAISGLPEYSWDHSNSFWYESRLARDWRKRSHPHHCLLGSRTLESPDLEPQWRNILSLEQEPWLMDHKVDQDVVFPLACYVAMAGEAVRQMTGQAGYSIRHAVARVAMVLTDTRDTEIITTLHPHRLTDSDSSSWFTFSICSYNGANWIKHVEGQVRPLGRIPCSTLEQEELPRKVAASRLYEALGVQGINLGPEFRGLEGISTSVSTSLASANIAVPSKDDRKAFTMHPLVIDACIQLFIVAQVKGLCRDITQLVPVQVESLDIFPHGERMTALAWESVAESREVIEATADGEMALRLSGLKLESVGGDPTKNDVHAAARLEWLPDADFVKAKQLIKTPPASRNHGHVLEEMALLCILDSAERLEKLPPARPHFAKLRRWLQLVAREATTSNNPLVPNFASYLGISREERRVMITNRHDALVGTTRDALARGLKLIHDNCERIFKGEEETIDILMTDGVLTKIYDAVSFDYGNLVRIMSCTRPKLRILEVGAGTGGTTEHILRNMLHQGGLPQYSAYTFTDVSAGFFPQAKDRFSHAPNMEYMVFDITRDPIEQGFTPATYDLIIAANVVHATPSLEESLRNLNKLLKPGGVLLLSELYTQSRSPGYVFGHFEGWWLGENDGRPNEPFVDPSRWHEELLASGFTGIEEVIHDEEAPYALSMTIVSKRMSEELPQERMVSLVTCEPQGVVARSLIEGLQQIEFVTTLFEMGEELPTGQDVIMCVDLEKCFFQDIGEESFQKFQNTLKCLSTAQNLLWLTNPAQINCIDPRAAQSIGVARTIRAELGLKYHTLEIKKCEAEFAELVLQVLLKIRRQDDEDNLEPDREFVVEKGIVYVGRYHPFSLQKELVRLSTPEDANTLVALESGNPSAIEALHWVKKELPRILPPGAVEIEVKSVGINFRDVLIASGVYNPRGTTPRALGLDASGVISAIGSNVRGFEPGDRVLALTPNGCFGTKVVVNSQLVAKMPEGMKFEAAATIPAVFHTAIKTLLDMGNLKGGQSVLIHSACGGLGMAAIQVCNMVGAEIYATVGSDEKLNHLVDKEGIPRARIFSSRDESFMNGIMKATNNRGVDLVLNSLSGNLLHASWKCVAEFGIMIEVGKRDLLGHGQLDMHPFLGNRQYACFDGLELARKRPDQVSDTLNRFLAEYQNGQLKAIPKMSCFRAKDVVDAFRHLQNGSHMGKVVVSMALGDIENEAEAWAKPIEFDSKATYLLVGGLGGLGRSMAIWLVEHGARSMTFLSRSAGVSEMSKATQLELERMGCQVTLVAGAAENMDNVQTAINSSVAPIRGVFHLAMVLRDSAMVDMTWEQWDAVTKPKVNGAWNLHLAFAERPLDFFWIASSLVSVIGHPGQGNYAASSSFLEAFCQFRRNLGLPTAVLNISPIRGAGYIAESATARRNMRLQGAYYLGEKNYLDFVELTLLTAKAGAVPCNTGPISRNEPLTAWSNTSQVLMGLRSDLPLEDAMNRCSWRHDRRMGSYHNISGEIHTEGCNSGVLKSLLNQISNDVTVLENEASIQVLAREVGTMVNDLLLRPSHEVDTELTLPEMGLDSLMATELRRWFRQVVGIEMSVLEMMSGGSLTQLAKVAATRLRTRHT